jgi:Zn-dependent protease with chaperone function
MRHLEKQADIFAIEQQEDPQSFSSAMTKLANQNLIDPSPSRCVELLFYDHPPISRRLRYADTKKNQRTDRKSRTPDMEERGKISKGVN